MKPLNYFPEDFIISHEEWAKEYNDDLRQEVEEDKVINHPTVLKGFEVIMDTYKPKHKKVIFSLCTSTRPYYLSVKWKAFMENFGNDADLIICTNAGIIPMEYAKVNPYLTYDAPRTTKHTPLYIDVFKDRLTQFIEKFGREWDDVVYAFLPTSRNAQAIRELDLKGTLLPSEDVYWDVRDYGSPGVNTLRYPQVAHQALNEMSEVLHIPIKRAKTKKLF